MANNAKVHSTDPRVRSNPFLHHSRCVRLVGPYDDSRCTQCFEVVLVGCGSFNPCAAHVAVSNLLSLLHLN